MNTAIPSLRDLIKEFNKFPGLGLKTSERLAYFILQSQKKEVDQFCESLKAVKEKIRKCHQCFSFTEKKELCYFCDHPLRKKEMICVVENTSDLWKIESSGSFHGVYHVLHGLISPLKNITPKDLTIFPLLERLKTTSSELILALNSDAEGETTALYITEQLKEMKMEAKIRVTKMAQGLPFGALINYVDQRTLGKAMENRVEI